MMDNAEHQTQQSKAPRIGKVFPVFSAICVIILPLVVLAAFSYENQAPEVFDLQAASSNFDHNGKAVFESYDRIVKEYLEGFSTERNLEAYYTLRQYPGSPPFIPHKVEDGEGAEMACLTCHAEGGWTQELKRHTPITPHPQQTACRQCHVPQADLKLFVDSDWMSVAPPRLGRSYLPGGPPPIPHDLQMRGECIACHVGPGAVTEIRVQHPSRGNCRQCHVPDLYPGVFQRKSDY